MALLVSISTYEQASPENLTYPCQTVDAAGILSFRTVAGTEGNELVKITLEQSPEPLVVLVAKDDLYRAVNML